MVGADFPGRPVIEIVKAGGDEHGEVFGERFRAASVGQAAAARDRAGPGSFQEQAEGQRHLGAARVAGRVHPVVVDAEPFLRVGPDGLERAVDRFPGAVARIVGADEDIAVFFGRGAEKADRPVGPRAPGSKQ